VTSLHHGETSGQPIPVVVYGCTTLSCDERFRGFTDEDGLFCSICLQDLTAIDNVEGLTLDAINARAEQHRPFAEVPDA
jgi:hypothetical protein